MSSKSVLNGSTQDFDLAAQLAVEEHCKVLVNDLMQRPGFKVDDISANKKVRWLGVDFLLRVHDLFRVGCENKFDHRPFGRLIAEYVSVDRPGTSFKPGWLFTSQAGVLCYWLICSCELIVIPLDDFRQFVFSNPLESGHTTTARNPKGNLYLSWSDLPRARSILEACPRACVVDFEGLGGFHRTNRRILLNSRNRHPQLCPMQELPSVVSRMPARSKVRAASHADIQRMVIPFIERNFKIGAHHRDILNLMWAREYQLRAFQAQQ